MATECRENKKRRNRYRIVRAQAYTVLLLLLLFGGLVGGFIGRMTAPKKVETVTITETVTVPKYETDELPEIEEYVYFDVPLSHSLQAYIYEVCSDEKVPVSLVMAMIEHESQFDPEVISTTGDFGLMQINEINHDRLAEDYRCADMNNSYQNVFCGVKIISSYLKEYDNDYTKALMAYNMGDYGAKKAWDNGITSTYYTVHILELLDKYEEVKAHAENVDNE